MHTLLLFVFYCFAGGAVRRADGTSVEWVYPLFMLARFLLMLGMLWAGVGIAAWRTRHTRR